MHQDINYSHHDSGKTTRRGNYHRVFILVTCLLLVCGCLPDSAPSTKTTSTPAASVKRQSTPTPLLAGGSTVQPLIGTPGAPPALTQETPILFTFPTPAPAPVSLWRPPLYPVPWALGANDHFYFSRPIAADEVNWPLANYRYGGVFFGTSIIHTGIDIPNPRGTPVIAAASGKVVWAGNGLYTGSANDDDPYGLAVVIKHDFGYRGGRLNTVYAHMDRIDVKLGQRVETGTQLGIVGLTGATTGPHLHFEVRLESNSFYHTRNPELWLSPPQGWGVLVGRLLNTNGSMLERQEVTVISIDTGKRWSVISYGGYPANSDDYYQENMVLSDLPAGEYLVIIDYLENRYSATVTIHEGAITYFTFQGENGFSSSLP